MGREEEIAAIGRALHQQGRRLITLTGPGGVGKTVLALEVARNGLEEFIDGVCFVSLTALSDPSSVPSVIGQFLGVPRAVGRSPLVGRQG